ncbi:hypothetical protein G6F31_015251 [Rhizopus arrhizus]|nr:hypothetical protein G6F31_015251 [Rhizopus arrhizus]
MGPHPALALVALDPGAAGPGRGRQCHRRAGCRWRPGGHPGHPAGRAGAGEEGRRTEPARPAVHPEQHGRAPVDAQFHGRAARRRGPDRGPAAPRPTRPAAVRRRTGPLAGPAARPLNGATPPDPAGTGGAGC